MNFKVKFKVKLSRFQSNSKRFKPKTSIVQRAPDLDIRHSTPHSPSLASRALCLELLTQPEIVRLPDSFSTGYGTGSTAKIARFYRVPYGCTGRGPLCVYPQPSRSPTSEKEKAEQEKSVAMRLNGRRRRKLTAIVSLSLGRG